MAAVGHMTDWSRGSLSKPGRPFVTLAAKHRTAMGTAGHSINSYRAVVIFRNIIIYLPFLLPAFLNIEVAQMVKTPTHRTQ